MKEICLNSHCNYRSEETHICTIIKQYNDEGISVAPDVEDFVENDICGWIKENQNIVKGDMQ